MAGYTTITIGGQQVGLRFGLPAIKRISDKIHLLTGAEEITLNLMSMVHILYAGYVNECLANDQEPALEFKIFYEYAETSAVGGDMTELKNAMQIFASSKEVKEVKAEPEKKSQKKSTGKK